MVREAVDAINGDKIERVLVCITSQISSQRLIDKAAEIADNENAELHILHVQQGNSIFNNADTPKMIHSLCQYGSKKGGTMHFYCHEDVPECIGKFVSEKYITKIIKSPLISQVKKLYRFLLLKYSKYEPNIIPKPK